MDIEGYRHIPPTPIIRTKSAGINAHISAARLYTILKQPIWHANCTLIGNVPNVESAACPARTMSPVLLLLLLGGRCWAAGTGMMIRLETLHGLMRLPPPQSTLVSPSADTSSSKWPVWEAALPPARSGPMHPFRMRAGGDTRSTAGLSRLPAPELPPYVGCTPRL